MYPYWKETFFCVSKRPLVKLQGGFMQGPELAGVPVTFLEVMTALP
jgi:hypothetical protein